MVFQTDFLREIIIRQIQMFQHLTDHFRQCTVCHACRQAVNRLHTVQFFFIRRRSIYFRMFHLTAAIFYGDFPAKHHHHAPSQRTSEKWHVKPGDFALTGLVCDRRRNHSKIPHFFHINIACYCSHDSYFFLILCLCQRHWFPENIIITRISMQNISDTVYPQFVEQCFRFLSHSFQRADGFCFFHSSSLFHTFRYKKVLKSSKASQHPLILPAAVLFIQQKRYSSKSADRHNLLPHHSNHTFPLTVHRVPLLPLQKSPRHNKC